MVDYEDPANIIKTVLDDNWNASNHKGVKPKIKVIYGLLKISQAKSSTVSIIEVNKRKIYDYSARKRHDETARIQVDVRTKSRAAVKGIAQEAERILEENQSTIGDTVVEAGQTNGFNQVWVVDNTDLSNRKESFHREVIDIELWKIGVVRSTA